MDDVVTGGGFLESENDEKVFECSALGFTCSFIAQGQDIDAVARHAADHLRETHKVFVTSYVLATIKEEIRNSRVRR
ncbi:MAG: hypothetical protein NVSMB42_04480 [Herpetosiphon sp.]